MTDYSKLSTDELGDFFSDYHKDTFGFRPRHIAFNDRDALIGGLISLDEYFAMMKKTPQGRNELRDNGWIINDPQTAEQDGWVDQNERDRLEMEAALAAEVKERELEASYDYPGAKYEDLCNLGMD